MAVTDPQGRVRGVAGLRVVDASLFPVVPCANTNFPTLMTARRSRMRCSPRREPNTEPASAGSGSGMGVAASAADR
jgi:choline dehydrogenase-like flavoprotein